MQLFGFRKTPDLSLAPLQASALETCGLRSGDGRLLVAAARSHILANPPYTRDLLSTIGRLSSREGLSTAPPCGRLRSRRREVYFALSKASAKPSSGTSMLMVRLLVSWIEIFSSVPVRIAAISGSLSGTLTMHPTLVQVCT